MIKKFKYGFLMMLALASLEAAVYEYDIDFSAPTFLQRSGHIVVDIPGCLQVGVEGEPLRPHYSVSYLLPPGETLDKFELIVERSETLPLMLPLLPKQPDRPLSWGNSNKSFMKHEDVYLQDEYATGKAKVETQWYRGAAVVMGTIDPTRYYPASGLIDIARSVKLKVTTKPENNVTRLSVNDEQKLLSMIQNPEVLSQYSFTEDPLSKMLIITSNQWKSAFDTLVTHYKKYGIDAQIMSVQDIQFSDVQGRDIPEMIRNKIWEIYLTEGLDYILLGGNSTIVPHRGLSCQVLSGGTWVTSDDIPADLYYAALDGTWDRNGNDLFGEYLFDTGFDEADLLPELAIGRMPAATLGELENMIMKSIRYQREPIVEELDKHVFFGEFLYDDPESWADDYLELLIGAHSDNGYTTRGIPTDMDFVKWYDRDSLDQWDRQTVIDELAAGTSFLHHDGHSNYTYMMKTYTSQINDSDFVTVNGIDHTTPIFYSHGCNCGGFDHPDCIASRFVTSPYITVGGVFNSRYGWFNEGQTEGPSIHLHREFENSIYGLNFDQFGWALSVSKLRTAPWVTAPNQHEQNALRWNYYTQNILGDPAMRIYSDKPIVPIIHFDISGFETGIIKASVSSDSDAIENAGVAIFNDSGERLAFGLTDMNGNVELTIAQTLETGSSLDCYISGNNLIMTDTTVVLVKSSLNAPEDYVLLNNYPNPFNPSTTIEFALPDQMNVTIGIYDLNGKLMKVLVDAPRAGGHHTLTFNAQDMPSGMYVCRLKAGDVIRNKKLLLIK
jgi:hypothetical protein